MAGATIVVPSGVAAGSAGCGEMITTQAIAERGARATGRASTLVFADDASPHADVAWLWVNAHRWPGWTLEIVTASPPHWDGPADRVDVRTWQPEYPRVLFGEAAFASTSFLRAASDPRLVLLRPAGLTVLGDHGPGLLKRMHVGSTLSWLLRSPSGPLVVARHGRTARRVLVCHDGGPHADAALAAFAGLPLAAETHAAVLTVAEPGVDVDRVIGDAVATLLPSVVDAEGLVRRGDAADAIGRAVRELDPDLVVLGTAGRSGIDRLALGSTAAAVTFGCTASVLVARAVA